MIAELHCHTSEYSACSHVNAIELVRRAFDMGMQAIIITDHHYQWNEEDLAAVKKKSGVQDFFQILAGQEFKTSDYGDILVYGVKETIRKQSLTVEEVRNLYPDAAIIWAHPYRNNKIPKEEKLLNPVFDAIEILSSNYTVAEAARALKDWHKHKFTAIAGTDTHALSYTGAYPTIFDHPFTSIEEFVREIKGGRCRPFFKEIPRAGTTDTKITEITIGPRSSKDRKKIILKTHDDINSWKEGERTFHLINVISEHGFQNGTYRVSKPLDKDQNELSFVEEHVQGDSLHDKLLNSEPEEAKHYLLMAARWLAEFHNHEFKITPPDEYLSIEKERLEYYVSTMRETNHEHTARVEQILDEIWSSETKLITSNPNILVQGHGDFHLKNIIIGQDKNSEAEYIALIDFNSSYQLPKAFDVGTFLAQYKNMFFDMPEIIEKASSDIFLNEYLNKAEKLPMDFEAQVQLYKARTYLSVIYYLVKVGKGNSENFWTILVNAERSLAHTGSLKEW